MLKSRYKFFAFTHRGFEKSLASEINSITPAHVSNVFGKIGVQFRSDLADAISVITKVPSLTRLNIQVGHPFHSSNIKSVRSNLENVNLYSFLNFERSGDRDVRVSASSYESLILNPKEIKEEFNRRLVKMMEGLNCNEQTDTIPTVYLNNFKDKLLVSLNVFDSQLHETSSSFLKGYNRLSSGQINLLLKNTGMLDEFKENGMKLFDPFMQTGSLLAESLLSSVDVPRRLDLVTKLPFWNWPLLKSEDIRKALTDRLEEIRTEIEKKTDLAISMIGTESSPQFKVAEQNFDELKRIGILDAVKVNDKRIIPELKDGLDKRKINYKNYRNKVLIINGRYDEIFSEENESMEKFTMLTTVPSDRNGTSEHKKLAKFMNNERHRFEDFFVLTNDDSKWSNFVVNSNYIWDKMFTFRTSLRHLSLFKLRSFEKPVENKTVTIVTKKMRRGMKPKLIKTKFDLRKINQIEGNSRKTEHVKRLLNTKLRNQSLKKALDYKQKIDVIRERKYERLEDKKKNLLLGETQKYLPEDEVQRIKLRIGVKKSN